VLTGCAPGRCLAGTGRQFGADLDGEVQVRLVAGHLLQAFGDERGGLGDVTTALCDPRGAAAGRSSRNAAAPRKGEASRHRPVPMFSNL
jgi:hypothetical protein